MAANLSTLQKRFRQMGKMIYLSQQAPDMADTIKKTVTGLLAQDASADAGGYDALNKSLIPFTNTTKAKADSVAGLVGDCKTAIQNHLQQVVAVDLGLPIGSSLATVGPALVTQMNSASAHVEPSGAGGSNSDGICIYFKSNFNITLPQNASPSIPDTYIDDDVIEV